MDVSNDFALPQSTPPYNQVRLLAFKQSSLDAETRTISGWASTPEVDSYDEIILPSAYEKGLPRFMRNPVHFWNHQWNTIPIGSVLEARVEAAGLWVKNSFGTTYLAEQVWRAVAIDKSVRAMSVGFDGYYSPEYGYWDQEQDRWIWTNINLLEISTVGMPACMSAQYQLSRALGLPMLHLGRASALPLANPGADYVWNSHLATKRIAKWAENADPARSEGMFLFNREFPLVDIIDEKPRLVWAGVACAMCQLLGARGGVNLPDGAKRTAFKTLTNLYQKFDKQTPTWSGGEWPDNFAQVAFHSDEPDLLEQTVALDNAAACERAAKSLSNIAAHWQQEGRGLSPALADNARSSIRELERVLATVEAQGENDPSSNDDTVFLIQFE